MEQIIFLLYLAFLHSMTYYLEDMAFLMYLFVFYGGLFILEEIEKWLNEEAVTCTIDSRRASKELNDYNT